MTTEVGTGRPRDSRIDAAVLGAAREVLSEVGYAGLTLTEVAARAGTSVPALRRRWPGKVHLVHHVLFPSEVTMPPRNPNATLDDEIVAIIDGCAVIFGDCATRQAVIGLIGDLGPQADVQQQLTDRLRDVVWPDVTQRLRDAAARDGIDAPDDPTMVIEMAFGGTLAAVLMRGGDGLDDAWRASMRRVLRAVLAAGD
ncbi:TetR/AcrR family transcriptional regulator [Gordonia humi]|uniref:AcrR family transcriptional regulator n=1 Tax=Gordonia humi TaxID=686429 RepID=A0A840F555_9ACTN|nr:TetR/AcrR family transcriptional regulator [Gordonia humi]MBB4137653.1 AcrR family transcriptional regulator [Gordonia humi]